MLLQQQLRLGSSKNRQGMSRLARRLAFGALTMAFCAPALAGPEGQHVVAGQASFHQFGPSLTVNASNGAIINYWSFNIGPTESVRFNLPSSDSRVLNRITGPDPSVIAGRLDSNGIVYIANPAGVYFRQGALVNVGQIYAGAGHLSDADFAQGRNHFTDITGDVSNAGVINAQAAHLIGQAVSNAGVINSPSGVVTMVSGDDVLIGEAGGTTFVRVNSTPSTGGTGNANLTPESARVSNTGEINAGRGRVNMVAGDVYGMAIFNGGRVKARDINIEGQGRGVVDVSGSLDASTNTPGERGGRVSITGQHVRVEGATVDASGPAGGGRIMVGGDFQGTGTTRRSETTYVDSASTLRADGTAAGSSGGTVVNWSDRVTGFYGTASAQGGEGGQGGTIETSGKVLLDVRGAVIRAGAQDGVAGIWLLDPSDVTIQNVATSNATFSSVTGAYTLTADNAFVNAADISSALSAGANVTIHTNRAGGSQSGNITVVDGITSGSATNVTFRLQAANNITINVGANITASGAGAMRVELASNDVTTQGGISDTDPTPSLGSVSANGNITTNGGDLVITNAAGSTINAGIPSVTLSGTLDLGAGALSVTTPTASAGTVTLGGPITAGSVNVVSRLLNMSGGTVTTTGNQTYRYGVTSSTQGMTLNAATNLTSTGGSITLGQTGDVSTIRGANTLTLNANGTLTINTNIGSGGSRPTGVTATAAAINFGTSAGFVNTNAGAQSWTGPVTVSTTPTFTFTAGTLSFSSSLRPAASGGTSLSINTSGQATFNGDVGGGSLPFSSITMSGGGLDLFNNGTISSTGTQQYINAVQLGADATFTGTTITFQGNVDGTVAGQQSLTITGNTVISGSAGSGATPLEFVSVSGTAQIEDDVTTAGVQTYGGAVTLGGTDGTNRVLTGSTITFNSTLNALTAASQGVDFTGNVVFNGAVGGTAALGAISTTGGTTTIATTTVNTSAAGALNSGNQTYGGAVVLGTGNDTVVTLSTGGGTASFASTVDATTAGEQGLAVTGAAVIGGSVGGGTALRSLSVSGATQLSANVSTSNAGGGTGNQTYTGDVVLGGANDTTYTLTSTGGTVGFGAGLDALTTGEQGLVVTGNASFAGAVGGATALRSLSVSGTTSIAGTSMTTSAAGGGTGAQTYTGGVTLASGNDSTVVFTGSTVDFAGGVNGTTAGEQGIIVNGGVTFGANSGVATALRSISVNGAANLNAASIVTSNVGGGTGNQTYSGAVTLGNSTVGLTSTGGTVSFTNTVDAAVAGTQGLSITGVASFDGAVGSTAALGSLAVSGTTAINGGSIATSNAGGGTGDQTYSGAVTIGGANGTTTTLTSTGGTVTFSAVVNALAAAQQGLILAGNALFGASAGGTNAFRSLSVSGTTQFTAGTTITTSDSGGGSGNQTYTGATTIAGTAGQNVTLSSGNGAVGFGSTIDSAAGGARGLVVTAAGNTTFGGAIGGGAVLSHVQTNGGGTTTLSGGAITTNGATVVFDDAVTLTVDTTITDSGGGITFNSTVDGNQALTLNTPGGGNILLVGNVGSGTALTNLTTTTTGGQVRLGNGSTAFTAAVSGSMDLGGAVRLSSNSTLSSSGAGAIRFRNAVDSLTSTARTLAVNTTGATQFDSDIGTTNALTSVTTNAGGTVQLGNATGGGASTLTIRTSGAGGVNLGEAAVLDADVTINTTGVSGNAVFGSTVNSLNASARALNVNVTGLTRFGGDVGTTNALSTITTGGGGGTTFGNGGAGITLATTGNQTYNDAVTLGSGNDTSISFSSTGGTVAFANTVDAGTSGEQGIAVTGNASFASAVGGTTALAALSVSGTSAINTTSIATTNAGGGSGNQTYTGAATLGTGNDTTVTLTSTGGTVGFGGGVSGTTAGEQSLSVAGNASFAGATGTALGAVGVSGTTALNGATLSTTSAGGASGNQSFTGAVTLGGANDSFSTLSSAGGTIGFGSTIDATTAGEQGLLITGNSTFAGVVGGGTALRELSVSGTTSFNTGATGVTTSNAGGGTGDQSYTGAVTLNNGNATTTTLTSTGGAVNFGNTIDGAAAGQQALSIAGNAAIGGSGAIGGTQALRSLSVSGTSQIGSSSINTTNSAGGTGDQTYTGAVTLIASNGSTTTLASTGGTVALNSTVDASGSGQQSLAVTGNATFGGAVGGGTALGGLSVSGTSSLPASVTTTNAAGGTGNQTYTGAATLTADTTLTATGGRVTFGSTLDGTGAGTEDLAIVGNATLGGVVGGGNALGELSVSGATALNTTSVTTTNAGGGSGNQTYTGAVVIGVANDTDVSLTSTGGTVGFGGTVDGTTAGEQGLSVTGNGSFGGAVGGTTALRDVSVSGTTALGGNVTTSNAGGGSGDQTYTGAVTLSGTNDSTVTATSTGGTITFGNTVDATTSGEQSLSTSGNVSFGGNVGGGTALGALSASGGTISLPAAVTTSNAGGTTGDQTYGSAITLTTDTTLTATGGTVGFNSTVDGTTAGQEDLTVTGGASFGGAVGGTTALGNLSVSGASALNGGAVTTQGTQTYTGAVTLGADTTLNAGASAVSFGSTINSADATARDLTVNSTTGTTFGGDVGTTFALDSLTTDAGGTTTINGATVTTSGDQTFGDDVVLGTDVTLNAASVTFSANLDGTTNNTEGLTINTPSNQGAVSFGGTIGGTTPLQFLTINGVLTLVADTTFVINSISLANVHSIGGAWNLTLTCTGDAAIGNTTNSDSTAAVHDFLSNGTGTTTLLAGSTIFTTGTQTYSSNGGTLIGGTVGQVAAIVAGGAVSFTGTLDSAGGGARGLSVDTAADTTFGGVIGGTTPILSLSTLGGGTTRLNGGAITASGGDIVFSDGVVLGADTTINNDTGAVTFNATVDSDATARDLSVTTTSGLLTFGADVGDSSVLDTFTVNTTTGTITFGAGNSGSFGVTTDGAILVCGPTILQSDMTFTAANNSQIRFCSTVDSVGAGAHALAANTGGLTRFDGNVGATNALASLSTDAGGSTQLGDQTGGGAATISVTTSGVGGTTFGDAVSLDADATLGAGTGSIAFNSTVDSLNASARSLSTTTTGATSFGGSVGATNQLSTLTTAGGGNLTFGTGAGNVLVSTSGAQSYTSNVIVNVGAGNTGTFTATAGGTSFLGTLNAFGAGVDTVSVTNDATLGGDVGGTNALAALSVGGAASVAGNVTTSNAGGGSGNQTYTGAVTLSGANDSTQTFTSTGGTVSFGSTVDGTTAGEQGLAVVGDAAFNGIVGGTVALASLNVSGASAINTTAISTTNTGGGTGDQTYTGAVTFGTGNDSTITFNATGGTVTFGAAVDGATAGEQAIVVNGAASFGGAVGAGTALASLNVTGQTTFAGTAVTTTNAGGGTGNQVYGGNVILNSGDDSTVTFTATGGSVAFGGGISGTTAGEQSVVVTGDASLAGSTTTPLGALTVTGNTTLGAVTLDVSNAGGGTGAITLGGVTLNGAAGTTAALNAVGGNITLGNVEAQADNGQSLAVSAVGGGQTLFNGTVGATNALASLLVTGGASINTTSLRTTNAGGGTGDQTYNGVITFGTGNDSTITFDATGGTVLFSGALNGQTAGEQAVVITGNASFGGAIGATTALASISVGGSTSINGQTVVTTNAGGGTGNQNFTGPVTFTSGPATTFTFNTTGGTVAFGSTLDGSAAGAESVVITGNTTFGGIVGGTNALAALTVNGTAAVNTTAVNTTNAGGGSGNQTYTGTVTLGAANDTTTIFTATGGTVAFQNGVTGTTAGEQSLSVVGNGSFAGTTGTALGAVTVSGNTTLAAATIVTTNAGGGTGAQTYSGAVTLGGANDTTNTLNATGGDVTFASTINATTAGEQGLVVTNNAAFNGAVGGTTALSSLSVGGTSSINTLTVNTTNAGGGTGNQTYTGAVTLQSGGAVAGAGATNVVTMTSTGGTVAFGATLNASGSGSEALAVVGNASFAGAVGATNRLFHTDVSGTANVANDVSTTTGQRFGGAVTLSRAGASNNGLSTFDGGSGPMTFQGNINGTASGQQGILVRTTGTRRFIGGVASNNTLPVGDGQLSVFRAYQVPIGIGGSIGGTTPLRSVTLDTQRTTIPGISTIVFASNLTSDNRVPDSTSGALLDATTFTIRATDTVRFGFRDKVLSFGTLTISGAPGNTLNSAQIGDITSLRGINITADQIAIQNRGVGQIIGQSNTSPSNTVVNNDQGIDLVASSINFSVEPFFHNGDISSPTQIPTADVIAQRLLTLASPDGSGVSVPGYATVQAFGGGDLLGNFTDNGAPPVPSFVLPFDLRSQGPVNTSISNTIAAFVVIEPPNIQFDTSLGSALREELRQIAVLTRDLGADEIVEFLVGRALYDDRFAAVALGGEGVRGVSVGRLAADVVRKVLAEFKELKADQDGYRSAIEEAYTAFLDTEEGKAADFDTVAFNAFVMRQEGDNQAKAAFTKLAILFADVDQLGLGPVETIVCKRKIVGAVRPTDMTEDDLVKSIETPKMTAAK